MILILVVAVISFFWPKYEERFFELSLLGKNKKADNYFLRDNSSITLGSQIDWYIYIHNHMGNLQDVIVKVKLLNSSMDMPIDRDHEPSSQSSIIEPSFSLSIDETLFVPFSWNISEIISHTDSITIKSIMVNDKIIQVNVSDSPNYEFYLVFELWVYNKDSNEYKFGWEYADEFFSSSLHMSFRLKLSLD